MIIVLNGYPGVGKLTVGRQLAKALSGRLLDIHSVYNVGFALTELKSPEFKSTVEKVERIAHDLILKRPQDEPVVLTTVLAGDGAWGASEWARIVELGAARPPFLVVHLSCDLDENIKRVQNDERDQMRKLRDPNVAIRNHADKMPLLGAGEKYLLKLDNTDMPPAEAADHIAHWALSA